MRVYITVAFYKPSNVEITFDYTGRKGQTNRWTVRVITYNSTDLVFKALNLVNHVTGYFRIDRMKTPVINHHTGKEIQNFTASYFKTGGEVEELNWPDWTKLDW